MNAKHINESEKILHEPFLTPPTEMDSENVSWEERQGIKCSFERTCLWSWNINATNTFRLVTGEDAAIEISIPKSDATGNKKGHFLHAMLLETSQKFTIKSPIFPSSRSDCSLKVQMHQSSMQYGSIRVVIQQIIYPDYRCIASEIEGNDARKWILHNFRIGRISKKFRILIEVNLNGTSFNLKWPLQGYVNIDNIELKDCFQDSFRVDKCKLRCKKNKKPICLETRRICDINSDCDSMEDELYSCGEYHLQTNSTKIRYT
jgi:anaplastic lymphoma kinase